VLKERPSFTADQARAIITAAQGQYRVMFAIAAMTGLRVGEILALQVGDFDLQRGFMTVRRSVWKRKVSVPKTSTSQAVLPLPDALVSLVRTHIATLKSEWLFLNNRGKLFVSERVVLAGLWPVLDKLGIPRCGIHAFRHTHASLLLDTGATPKEAQEQLRHADPRITIGLYSHVQAESRRNAVEKIASILDCFGPNTEPLTPRIQ
jgi:integrase